MQVLSGTNNRRMQLCHLYRHAAYAVEKYCLPHVLLQDISIQMQDANNTGSRINIKKFNLLFHAY